MRPATYKAGGRGERIAYAVEDSPLGRMLVAATDKGLCALRFGDGGADEALLNELQAEFPQATLVRDPAAVAPYAQAALDHLGGRQRNLDLPVDSQASAFQQRVWAALRQIPYGQTRSYSQVAAMI